MRAYNLLGKRFGRLTVIAPAPNPRKGIAAWKCRCDCGNETVARAGNLTTGHTTSCGCFLSEQVSKAKRKPDGVSARNSVINAYKWHAKRRGFEWHLSTEECDVLFAGNCKYCGSKPSSKWKGYRSDFTYNGIDRVDSSKGYDTNNVVSCCGDCNTAKSDRNLTDFLAWAKRVVEHTEKNREQEDLRF